MDTILAINNSPYYYFKPTNQRSIGYTLPFTDRIVSKIADIALSIKKDLGIDFIPGVQLGSESDRAILSQRKRNILNRLADEKGIEYILHLPDQMVPGQYERFDLQQRMLGILQGDPGKSAAVYEREFLRRVHAASDLGVRYLVMHLPNRRTEDPERVLGYFSADMSAALTDSGITACIENCNNLNSPYYGDVGNLMTLVGRLGDPYCACIDYGHYLVDRGDVDAGMLAMACSKARAFHVHMNDKRSDKHLFLGERPNGLDRGTLDSVEKTLLHDVLKVVDPDNKAFVIERNRPFSYDQMRTSVSMLFSSLSS